jgi:periplasmic divalent cation tolerance protein
VPETLLVLTNLPDADAAHRLARGLVESRLAACVNALAPCRSFYSWEGGLQEDGEVPLFIKTTAKLYPAVEAYIQQHHPYDLPEIIALKIEAGHADYLRWVAHMADPQASNSA